MIDKELQKEISENLKTKHLFISSINNQGLNKLKDSIWHLLTKKDD